MSLLWREAVLSFRRTRMLSFLSVVTIAFALFVTGLFGLVALNLRNALGDLEDRVEVVAFLQRGTPTQTIAAATSDIAAFPEVRLVIYVSAEDALERARRDLVEFQDAYRDLEVNPLPPSFEIRLHEGQQNAATAAAVAERLTGFPFVEEVRYGQEWVQRLDQLRTIAGLVGFAIGLAFALVSMVIIGVTIRMTVLQRAREIQIMRLVGATDWFIRGPFIVEGAIKGFLGGGLALALCAGVYAAFRSQSTGLGLGLSFFGPEEILTLVLFGTLIGLAGSLVSVGRHLKRV
ncbi:MAG: permease-like cell division protein FtsX [Gemmatimonadales bacterium]|nr:permease-like cell division protein FtsX [Gemmatimonadales bacterium]MDZ4388549.1 permease-like cell division protein FtsX [Gemmatimonadales bacterium]